MKYLLQINHQTFVFFFSTKVGHDGITPQEGWYLDEVEVDIPTQGKHYVFPCKRWLSKDKDDGHIIRKLVVEDAQSIHYTPSKYTH